MVSFSSAMFVIPHLAKHWRHDVVLIEIVACLLLEIPALQMCSRLLMRPHTSTFNHDALALSWSVGRI